MARRRHEGACPRAAAVTCFPPEFAPCVTGAAHVLTARVMKLHGSRSVGVLSYPTAARTAPLGGRRGAARRPQGGMRRVDSTAPAAGVRQATVGRASCRMDRAPGNVAPASARRRVSCMCPGGGKTLRALGYELPQLVG